MDHTTITETHYHLLYGPTNTESPEHNDFFPNLETCQKQFNVLFEKYIAERENVFFKKTDEGAPDHTVMFGEIPDATLAKQGNENVIYGTEFKDTYMIMIYPCDRNTCIHAIN